MSSPKLTKAQKEVIALLRNGDTLYKDHYWGNLFFSKCHRRITHKTLANLVFMNILQEVPDVLSPNRYYALTSLGKSIQIN